LAVAAFAAEFADAPMLVTSQEGGQVPFETWRLPEDIKEHVDKLLRLYLGAVPGDVVTQRLKDSKLLGVMQTGYDVRLVADLSTSNPDGADLPLDRTDLYHKVMDAAWPEGPPERVRADQDILQAAAWKLCSELGPNVDKRKIRPDLDAPKDLLEALTNAGEQPGRHVRLVRRAGATFEFVHDQMNAYLAAVWLARRPTVNEMGDMLARSTVWEDTVEVQNTLWDFVVPLLDPAAQRKLCDRVRHEERWHTLRYKLEKALEKAGSALEWVYVPIDDRK
jgi:hypothetical protein